MLELGNRGALSRRAARRLFSDQVHPAIAGRSRFYKHVSVTALPPSEEDGGDCFYGVQLDGRLLRTPQRRPLRLPNERLAYSIASEW